MLGGKHGEVGEGQMCLWGDLVKQWACQRKEWCSPVQGAVMECLGTGNWWRVTIPAYPYMLDFVIVTLSYGNYTL